MTERIDNIKGQRKQAKEKTYKAKLADKTDGRLIRHRKWKKQQRQRGQIEQRS